MKKSILALLLLATLFMTVGCGSSLPEEPIGGDWRVQGLVEDYGTLTKNGESITVCVCYHDADATLYYDSEVQEIYTDLFYPHAVAESTVQSRSMDFSDLNGDGNSDIRLTMVTEDGTETVFTWMYQADSNLYMITEG